MKFREIENIIKKRWLGILVHIRLTLLLRTPNQTRKSHNTASQQRHKDQDAEFDPQASGAEIAPGLQDIQYIKEAIL